MFNDISSCNEVTLALAGNNIFRITQVNSLSVSEAERNTSHRLDQNKAIYHNHIMDEDHLLEQHVEQVEITSDNVHHFEVNKCITSPALYL